MLSTFCRGCGTYYKVLHGKAIPNPQACFLLDGLDATPTPASKPSIREARSRPQYQRRRQREVEAVDTRTHLHAIRNITCLECGHRHAVPERSASSLCPRCGASVPLKNHVISNDWRTPIQTRGDVLITHTGRIIDAAVRCFHLTVDGDFTGSADCDGDLIIRRHGTVLGHVRCRRLVVEKRAEVEFAHTVVADEVIIDGQVSGNIHCKGRLTLAKGATLLGDIRIASLAVAEGASHRGMVHMSSAKD